MPHRCEHVDASGLRCVFYLTDDDPDANCPLHSARSLLRASLHVLGRALPWGKQRIIVRHTELYLAPQARLSRGPLQPGASIRMLAAPHCGWLQVEVVRAARLPAQARGWIKQCAVR